MTDVSFLVAARWHEFAGDAGPHPTRRCAAMNRRSNSRATSERCLAWVVLLVAACTSENAGDAGAPDAVATDTPAVEVRDRRAPSDAEGPDLFRLAVNGAPTGSFLSVRGSALRPAAYLTGGFVGVDHARLPANGVGRLVEYTTGSFRTLCQSDEVLWWTVAVLDAEGSSEVIYAVGEGGRVLRYRDGACEVLRVDVAYPESAPTFWGIHGRSSDDLWLVGGSSLPDGPKGVLVHYDGSTFRQEPALPPEVAGRNLYKIDGAVDGRLYVVGEGGLILVRDPRTRAWSRVASDVTRGDDRLFTISCPRSAPYECWGVGGQGTALVISGNQAGFSTAPYFSDLSGLTGVWVQDPRNVWAVGIDGLTMHFDGHVNGRVNYHPTAPLTTAMLHGVGGRDSVILAVGGELGTPTPAQRGVILVRGDESERFLFDGQVYAATGSLRRTVGGFNQ